MSHPFGTRMTMSQMTTSGSSISMHASAAFPLPKPGLVTLIANQCEQRRDRVRLVIDDKNASGARSPRNTQ